MDETEWLSCDRLLTLLTPVTARPELAPPEWRARFTRSQAGRRKLRLFACACCRHDWDQIVDERSRRSVEVAEKLADEKVDRALVQETRAAAYEALRHAGGQGYEVGASGLLISSARRAAEAAYLVLESETGAVWGAAGVASYSPDHGNHAAWRQREGEQIAILRDIVGNPFRPATIEPALLTWRDATIPKLAQAAYDERELPSGHLDARRLAILADALEESGCTNEDVLAHLRGAGPHVRGCWVVDLLLGKE